MDFKKIKLVVCDVDNTLIPTKSRDLPPFTKRAIDKLHERGILFGIASGRGFAEVGSYYERWGFEDQFDVVICMNGGQVFDNSTKTLSAYNTLTKEMVDTVYEIMDPLPYAHSIFCGDGKIYHSTVNRMIEASMQRAGVVQPDLINGDVDRLIKIGAFKILYRVPPEEMADLEKYVDSKDTKDVRGFKTQPFCYEFCDKRVMKSFGLQKYTDAHGISLDEVLAFGDTTNDNDMLEKCYGVCLLNGTDDTKAVSKEITEKTCEEEGLADYLETHVFVD